MKKIFVVASFLIWLIFPYRVLAQDKPDVDLYIFWSSGCPHCSKEKEFLEKLVKEKGNLVVHGFEVGKNMANAVLYSQVGKYLGADTRGVPFTVIGSSYYPGFGSAETTGELFIEAIEKVERGEDHDIMLEFFSRGESGGEGDDQVTTDSTQDVEENIGEDTDIEEGETSVPQEQQAKAGVQEILSLPVFGNVNTSAISLPALTFIIALVDGFNPCAMWVLLFLISLLLGFKDRRRMWILGLTFIVASAVVYFLFMAAWLNFFLFVGFIAWVRLLVGLIALYFGYSSVRSFIKDREGGCEVAGDEKRIQTLQKIKEVAKKEHLIPAMLGMILLAFAVNLIEAICSAGLPAIYTQILTLNRLSTTQYYLYILLYQLIFMLDDIVVFIIAMVTLQSFGIESKYARWVKVIGGGIMLVIGILLIFKPELLLFG